MSKKVPIQKGPIEINKHTLKNTTYVERAIDDFNNDAMRRSMKTMELMTPKQHK